MKKLCALSLAALLLLCFLTSCLSYAPDTLSPPADEPSAPGAEDTGDEPSTAPTDEPDEPSEPQEPQEPQAPTEPSEEPEPPAEEPAPPVEEAEPETPGLVYLLNADGNSYSVKAGKEFSSTELIIPSRHDGKRVTAIARQGFFQNKQITRVILPDTIERIEDHAFYYCSSLAEINFPTALTHIGQSAFFNCTKLTKLSLGDKLVSIGRAAFSLCYGISEITLPDHGMDIGEDVIASTAYQNNEDNWESGALYLGNHLIAVSDELTGTFTVKSGTRSIASRCFANRALSSAVIPSGVEVIGAEAFAYCNSLRSVTLGEGIEAVSEGTFSFCTSLSSVSLPASLRTIGKSAFSECTALTSITLPVGLHAIGENAFRSCSALRAISLPDSVSTVGQSAFENCSSLSALSLGSGLTRIERHAFSGTAYLGNKANYENGLAYVDNYLIAANKPPAVCQVKEGTIGIAATALWNEDTLVELIIPDSVRFISPHGVYRNTNLTKITIGKNARIAPLGISYCPKLTEVTITNPDYEFKGGCLIDKASKTVIFATANATIPTDGSVTVIGENALFRSEVTTLVIPEGVVRLDATSLGECVHLTSLTLPASLSYIGSHVFNGCQNLPYITYSGTVQQWKEIEKATPVSLEIHCADGNYTYDPYE